MFNEGSSKAGGGGGGVEGKPPISFRLSCDTFMQFSSRRISECLGFVARGYVSKLILIRLSPLFVTLFENLSAVVAS